MPDSSAAQDQDVTSFTVKWGPDMPIAGHGVGDRDRHYVMFRGEWRHVPRIIQRAWERVIPKMFGGCATSTIYADGRWVGELAVEAWKREHRG